MSAQPIYPNADATFEVDESQITYHRSDQSLVFSQAGSLYRFYETYHVGFVPVTLFVRTPSKIDVRLLWSHPEMQSQSDY